MLQRRHYPQLDSLRALAVIGVMLSHFAHIQGLGVGVQLFFILSGFLITEILLKSKSQIESRLATFGSEIRKFYLRRSLRIFPIYYLVLLVGLVLNITPARETFFWHFFYLTNVCGFITGQSFGMFTHFWTLSVEEQFYWIWPLLIFLLPRNSLRWLVFALIVMAPMFRAIAQAFDWQGYYIWLLPSQIDGLGFGALLAIYHVPQSNDKSSGFTMFPKWLVCLSGSFALGCIIWLNIFHSLPVFIQNNVDMVLEAVFFSWLVGRATIGFGGLWGRLLNSFWLRYIGQISYGIYVYHNFAGFVAHKPLRWMHIPYPDSLWLNVPMEIGVSIAGAAVSWHFIEKPLLGLKARIH